jgi:hypothetical protein
MLKLLSAVAFAAGIWLVYTGYERQHSILGRADASLSTLGAKIDGRDHSPAYVGYYVSGFVLLAGGAMGLGLIKK